jgi:hypothetical protein
MPASTALPGDGLHACQRSNQRRPARAGDSHLQPLAELRLHQQQRLRLFNGDGQSPWCSGGSYSHSQDGTSISFNCYALPSSATLTAMLGSGSAGLERRCADALHQPVHHHYYDYNTHASLITQRPGNGASGVNANLPIVLYFNLPINSSGANSGIQVAQNNVAVPGTVQVLDSGLHAGVHAQCSLDARARSFSGGPPAA